MNSYNHCFMQRSTVNDDQRLLKEWHPVRNADIDPSATARQSNRSCWWRCSKGHEWVAIVANRAKGQGCPYCTGKRADALNSLLALNPKLATEWHPTKNGRLHPDQVRPGSGKRVWWLCPKGHIYAAQVYTRNKGSNCPACAGKIVTPENCLLKVNPLLAKDWHPTKNGRLRPRNVTANSHRKVWWVCGRRHEWAAVVASRNRGHGCPDCNSSTSKLELRVFAELNWIFHDALLRHKVQGIECDVFLPSIATALECDGEFWHRDKKKADRRKNTLLRKHGVDLIRIRERGLQPISELDVIVDRRESEFQIVKRVLGNAAILGKSQPNQVAIISEYIEAGRLQNETEYRNLLDRLPGPMPGQSLLVLFPALAAEWHSSKNWNLSPQHVSAFSNLKVWWQCAKRKHHEWLATVAKRSNGRGCPFCAGTRPSPENNLAQFNNFLASEWHPIKNGQKLPSDVTPSSHAKVWWQCTKGHEWQAAVNLRNKGNGCPFCSNKRVNKENCLATVNTDLAQEWH
ncbi:MAG: hypothetical protein DME24_17685 [Verrucomicrobia bacterium]|nr:MAG: hypothetical protein DME24_17685 [Verrucomicrobiota bacterium]